MTFKKKASNVILKKKTDKRLLSLPFLCCFLLRPDVEESVGEGRTEERKSSRSYLYFLRGRSQTEGLNFLLAGTNVG